MSVTAEVRCHRGRCRREPLSGSSRASRRTRARQPGTVPVPGWQVHRALPEGAALAGSCHPAQSVAPLRSAWRAASIAAASSASCSAAACRARASASPRGIGAAKPAGSGRRQIGQGSPGWHPFAAWAAALARWTASGADRAASRCTAADWAPAAADSMASAAADLARRTERWARLSPSSRVRRLEALVPPVVPHSLFSSFEFRLLSWYFAEPPYGIEPLAM